MKEMYLPLAENLVFEEEGRIKGFISLVGEKVCALFVAPDMQGKGTGRALLEYAKNLKGKLSLKVYRENKRAFCFYKKCGFVTVREEIDEYTGYVQILMEWEELQFLGMEWEELRLLGEESMTMKNMKRKMES